MSFTLLEYTMKLCGADFKHFQALKTLPLLATTTYLTLGFLLSTKEMMTRNWIKK